MKLPVVHHPEYVCELPPDHRFPMKKFGLLDDYLDEVLAAEQFERHRPSTDPTDAVEAAHGSSYLEKFRSGTLTERHQRRIGLPWSQELVQRTFWAVGGTLKTIELALSGYIACNTAGGTHHAFADRGSGFCILNDLAIGAIQARHEHELDEVLIVDLDVHQGNGTASICSDRKGVRTASLHCEANYPFENVPGDHDRSVPAGTGDRKYLNGLRDALEDWLGDSPPDLVLYDAGVDVHAEDQLGKLNLSKEGLVRRDTLVLSSLRDRGVPVACVIGGGYDDNLKQLARRHSILHQAAIKTFVDETHEIETG